MIDLQYERNRQNKKIIEWYEQGYTYDEISERIGISRGTVTLRIRALRKEGLITVPNRRGRNKANHPRMIKDNVNSNVRILIGRKKYSEAIDLLQKYCDDNFLSEQEVQGISQIIEILQRKIKENSSRKSKSKLNDDSIER